MDLVLSEDSRAKSQMRISGVPYFVISSDGESKKSLSLSGAQGTEQFLTAFNHIMRQ